MSEPTGDPARRPKAPKTKARLEQLTTQWQKDSGQPVARLNLRIAAMMLAGALARVVDPEGQGVFATKGGIAMELRMGDRARATRDVDLVLRGDPEQLAERLDEGLREAYRGFSFRRGAIGDLPTRPYVKKVRIQVSFAGRVLSSPQLEIAPLDTWDEEFVSVRGASLDAVGLSGPDLVLVLAERCQDRPEAARGHRAILRRPREPAFSRPHRSTALGGAEARPRPRAGRNCAVYGGPFER